MLLLQVTVINAAGVGGCKQVLCPLASNSLRHMPVNAQPQAVCQLWLWKFTQAVCNWYSSQRRHIAYYWAVRPTTCAHASTSAPAGQLEAKACTI